MGSAFAAGACTGVRIEEGWKSTICVPALQTTQSMFSRRLGMDSAVASSMEKSLGVRREAGAMVWSCGIWAASRTMEVTWCEWEVRSLVMCWATLPWPPRRRTLTMIRGK